MRGVAAVALAAALAASSCTDGGTTNGEPGKTSPRGFHLVAGKVEASFDLTDSGAILEITNGSDAEVGAPGVYALDPDRGDRVDAEVADARPIEVGASRRFEVRFPGDFDPAGAGFIGLELGGVDAGGFEQD